MQRLGTSGDSAGREFAAYWPLLLGCFIGVMCGVAALYFYTQGIFMKPIAAEFNWSRTTMSLGGFITLCSNAVLAPICGGVIDRIGVRVFATLSLLGFAAALALLSTLDGSVLQYYAFMVALALLSSGTSPLSFSRAVNEAFNSARGIALGIVGAGIGVSATLAPARFADIVATQGWRQGYRDMALLVLVATPFVCLLLRTPPAGRDATATASLRRSGVAGKEAVRSARFWILGGMLFSAATAASAVIVHFVPMLTDAGMTPQRAARYVIVIGVSVTVSRVLVGALLDRIFAPYIALIVFGAAAIGAVVLAKAGLSMAWLGALLMGLALGTESDLTGYMIARYFGIRAYGFIYGMLYAAFLVGMAAGPVLAGLVFDSNHSYRGALLGAAVMFGLAAALSTRLGAFPDLAEPNATRRRLAGSP